MELYHGKILSNKKSMLFKYHVYLIIYIDLHVFYIDQCSVEVPCASCAIDQFQ
jgi:hypothetical protein